MVLEVLAAATAIAFGALAVLLRDLVYASISLAFLGLATASILALSGYLLPAIVIVLVYVGSAVMFLIISVSMLGGFEEESRNIGRGAVAGLAAFALSILVLVESRGALAGGESTVSIDAGSVAEALASDYPHVVFLLALALLATALEGLLVLRLRGGRGD